MQNYSVRIGRRNDGLIVARIPSLSTAVGYGLDVEEALLELFRRVRRRPKEVGALDQPALASAATPT
jgi:hypothetical protein